MRRATIGLVLLVLLLLAGCSLFRAPRGELLYEERFTEAAGNTWWVGQEEGFRCWIADGKYHMESQADNRPGVWNTAAGQFSDFELLVDVEHLAGLPDKSAAGALFRFVDWSNHYVFLVSPSGFFTLRKVVGGDWETLKSWTSHDAVRQGEAVNRLSVTASGNDIVLNVNGQEVFRTADPGPPAGGIGVRGSSSEGNTTMHVAFDNIEVWSLP